MVKNYGGLKWDRDSVGDVEIIALSNICGDLGKQIMINFKYVK